jgi:hypothetical protein
MKKNQDPKFSCYSLCNLILSTLVHMFLICKKLHKLSSLLLRRGQSTFYYLTKRTTVGSLNKQRPCAKYVRQVHEPNLGAT